MLYRFLVAFVLINCVLAENELVRTRRAPIPVPLVEEPKTVSNSKRALDSICKEKYARYQVAEYCDSFIECRNYLASELVCPDGLHFNPNANIHEYPCVYPIDAPCMGKSTFHPAQPTAVCPRQFGFFRLGNAKSCGEFRSCVAGNGINFRCPQGLAFNPKSYECDWPENVPDCDVSSFIGFKCPAIPVDAQGHPFEGTISFPYPNDCRRFFACVKGVPRILSCDPGFAFDSRTSQCEPADIVPGCEAIA